MSYYIYILTNKKNGVLYIGVTNDITRRIYEHKTGVVEGFTQKYKIRKLVYFEETFDIMTALQRERQMKKWNRGWKIKLIEKENPDWKDLHNNLI